MYARQVSCFCSYLTAESTGTGELLTMTCRQLLFVHLDGYMLFTLNYHLWNQSCCMLKCSRASDYDTGSSFVNKIAVLPANAVIRELPNVVIFAVYIRYTNDHKTLPHGLNYVRKCSI